MHVNQRTFVIFVYAFKDVFRQSFLSVSLNRRSLCKSCASEVLITHKLFYTRIFTLRSTFEPVNVGPVVQAQVYMLMSVLSLAAL